MTLEKFEDLLDSLLLSILRTFLNCLDIIRRIKANAAFDSPFTPSLLVLVLELFKHFALLECQFVALGPVVIVKSFYGNARLALKYEMCLIMVD